MKTKILFASVILFIAGIYVSCNELKNDEIDEQNLNDEIQNAVITKFNGFYFVANNSGIPSLFYYDYNKDKIKLYWTSPDERVINLLISPDNKSGFFITKRKQRLKSSQPAIEKGKLYRINFDEKKVDFITQLEDGIQIIPYWTDNDRFVLVINSIDKTIASYINKNTQIYNRFGKLLSDNTEVFDITKDGYPVTKLPALKFRSTNELFTVYERNDSLFIKHNKSGNDIKTRYLKKEILKIEWAENRKHLLMLLNNKTDKTSKEKNADGNTLAIFDLKTKKTVKTFNDKAIKHFVLIGDFLIFDEGFGRDSQIEIFNLNSLSTYKIIKLTGGCGLRNIS